MKKFRELLKKPYFAYTFAICCGVLFYVVLNNLHTVKNVASSVLLFLSPVTTGVVFAYLVDPVCVFFEKKLPKKMKKPKSRRLTAVCITLGLLTVILGLLLFALIPSLADSISKLVSEWDYYTQKAQELLQKAEGLIVGMGFNADFLKTDYLLKTAMDKLVELLKNNSKTIMSTLGSVGTSVSNFTVGIGFGVCFLFAKKGLLKFLSAVRGAMRSPESIGKTDGILRECHSIFISYMGCTLFDSLIVGVATLIFALVMKMPYAPLLAVINGLANILPTFGPWLGTALSTFFLVLDKPVNALWMIIFGCILQTIDGMLIKPILFKDSLGIPAVWSLILIVIGGKVAGISGIILSIPFGAIFAIIYEKYIIPMLEKRKQSLVRRAQEENAVGEEHLPDSESLQKASE